VISQELLQLLACPSCKGPIKPSDDGQALLCEAERLRYRIDDGIPVMLVDEATSY